MPVERVWRAFTDSRVLERWMAAGASVTPREKGRMHVVFGAGVELDAHIDVLVTAQRMRLILLPTRGMPRHGRSHRRGLPVRARTEDQRGAAAVERSACRAAWVTYYLNKRRHWELALTRLKVFLEKGLDQERQS